MARPKSKGAYVPLAAQYFMDDAILEAGPDAELLFVRCLSFLASVSSDGFVTDRQMQTIVGLRLRNVAKRVGSLQEVGLLEAVEGGFLVRSWTKWNKSADEIGKLLAKDRERKARKDAENTSNSERNGSGIRSDSGDQYRAEQSSTEQIKDSSSDAYGADVVELCELLADLVRKNGHKVGVVGKTWWRSCERLMRVDEYTADQVAVIIRWATADEFWASNIRSMPKLREQFSTLRAQRNAKLNAKPKRQTPTERAAATLTLATEIDMKGIGQ